MKESSLFDLLLGYDLRKSVSGPRSSIIICNRARILHVLRVQADLFLTLLREMCRREILAKFRSALEINEAISPALKDDPIDL